MIRTFPNDTIFGFMQEMQLEFLVSFFSFSERGIFCTLLKQFVT